MTVTSLEVMIDASRMPQGAQQVTQELSKVSAAADATSKSMANVGRATSAAFQATGGTVQIAQGISQTATAFGQLNTTAAAFGASRTLLELGRTVDDFRQFRTAIGGASSAFGVFGALLRANPIGVIATGIGLAATAFGLFSSNTDKATESINKQNQALDSMLQKLGEVQIRASYGAADPRKTVSSTIDTLTTLRQSDPRTLRVSDAAGLYGLSEQDFRYLMGRSGFGESALELAQGEFASRGWNAPNRFRISTLTRDQAVAAGEVLLRDRQSYRPPDTSGFYQFGASNFPSPSSGFQGATIGNAGNFVEQSEEDRWVAQYGDRHRQQEEAQERTKENMREMIALAQGIGDTLLQAFASGQKGSQALRQALAAIGMDLARRGLSGAIASAFGGGAAPGATQTQVSQNTPNPNGWMNPGGS